MARQSDIWEDDNTPNSSGFSGPVLRPSSGFGLAHDPDKGEAWKNDIPTECECDNTHEANNTVCRYCWEKRSHNSDGGTMKCTQSTKGGKVHALVRVCPHTFRILKEGEGSPNYGRWAPLCDRTHDIDDQSNYLIDWWQPWKRVEGPVTCKSCLRLEQGTSKTIGDNKVWRVTYFTNVTAALQPAGPTKTVHLVAPNRTEAALLFGLNIPEYCAHPRNKLEQVSMEELLKEKRIL